MVGVEGFLSMESGTHTVFVLIRVSQRVSLMVSLRPDGLAPIPRILFGEPFPLQFPWGPYWGWDDPLILVIRAQEDKTECCEGEIFSPFFAPYHLLG